ncbi:SusC/RagA family TonB-linked outer membrane protein [Jiulongibacter sediminis]|uniref:Membrane protein n=1 Tax=Jiulongibacter sediminis TaxID=1605367 RepID=A0A0P7BLG4_9BACT|nr:TonB-dependent receptor [Jiulongibacter sediminis]KPM48096.1 membrane protein [Jiulongibacter sediminis]
MQQTFDYTLKALSKSWLLWAVVLNVFSIQAFAQMTVSGTVSDDLDGTGLPGATVTIKGSAVGTATDMDGKYSIQVPNSSSVLVFSFIGKQNQEITVGNQSVINVTLADDNQTLEEIVVIGYGTQKKQDMTGAITSINERDFVQGNVSTPDQLITGKLAGVQITSAGGAPGSGATIRIRGGSSLNASNDPLIVIDGVPIDNTDLSGSANPLSFINPNDIESMNVLKDASAAAIYGSRAANGVIIITTKKGRKGAAMQVNFNSRFSSASNINQVDVLKPTQFATAVTDYGTAAQQALLGSASTNWQDVIYRTALTQDNNLSVTGSLAGMPFRASVGFLNQNGTLKTSNLKRTSGSIGLSPSLLDDHLRVDANLKFANNRSQFADEGAIGTAVSFDPTQPVYASSDQFGGYFNWINQSGGIEALGPSNPLAMLELRDNLGILNRYIGNVSLNYSFHGLPELKAVVNAGFDASNTDGNDVTSPLVSANSFNNGGSTAYYTQNRNNKTFQAYLNYAKEFGASKVDLMGGYEYQGFIRENDNGTIYGNPDVPERNTYFKTEYRLASQFGRVNYVLSDKYLATVTLRRDGTSRFAPDNRYGLFPSAAFAWKMNEEFGLNDVLSDLKLRLGWGVTGQQDIGSGDFPYLAAYTPGQGLRYEFGGQFYDVLRPNPYDAQIKWEETTSSNIGLDFGIRAARLSGSVDFYLKQTKDLINEIDAPAGTNFSNKVVTNIGSLENKGVEFTLNYTPISNSEFNWDVNFNATYNQNKITALTRNEDPSYIGVLTGDISGGTGSYGQIHSTGFSRSAFYLYQQVYNENGSPIEGVFVDRNNDGVISELDRYRYQNPDPNYFLGFSSNMQYRDLSIGFIMRANIGNYVFNNVQSGGSSYANMTGAGNFIFNLNSNVLNSNFSSTTRREQILLSDYFVENASFLRMDNINLGYDLTNALKASKYQARLGFIVQNVFTVTNYTGLDPEVQGGIDRNIYPRPRTYSLNLNVNF